MMASLAQAKAKVGVGVEAKADQYTLSLNCVHHYSITYLGKGARVGALQRMRKETYLNDQNTLLTTKKLTKLHH